MLLGDGKKSAKLTRDGVDVKEQGRPPKFYPWGAGKDDEARNAAEQARALAAAADEKATTVQAAAEAADEKATTAQATAEAAQTEATGAAEAAEEARTVAGVAQTKAGEASEAAEEARTVAGVAQTKAGEAAEAAEEARTVAGVAQTKAGEAAEAAANAVQKIVPETKHRQTAGISLSAQNNAWSLGQNSSKTDNYLELRQNVGEADEFVAVRLHTREQTPEGPSNALLRLQYEGEDEAHTRYKVELKASSGLGDVGAHTLNIDGARWKGLSTLFMATLPTNGMFAICVYTDGAEPPRYMIATITKKGSTRTLGQILGTYEG